MSTVDFADRFERLCVQAWGDAMVNVEFLYANVSARSMATLKNPVTGTDVRVYPMSSMGNKIVAFGKRPTEWGTTDLSVQEPMLGAFMRRGSDLSEMVRRAMEFLADCQDLSADLVQVSTANAVTYGEVIRARGHEFVSAEVRRWGTPGGYEGKGLLVAEHPHTAAFVSAIEVDDDTAIIRISA